MGVGGRGGGSLISASRGAPQAGTQARRKEGSDTFTAPRLPNPLASTQPRVWPHRPGPVMAKLTRDILWPMDLLPRKPAAHACHKTTGPTSNFQIKPASPERLPFQASGLDTERFFFLFLV